MSARSRIGTFALAGAYTSPSVRLRRTGLGDVYVLNGIGHSRDEEKKEKEDFFFPRRYLKRNKRCTHYRDFVTKTFPLKYFTWYYRKKDHKIVVLDFTLQRFRLEIVISYL